MNYIKIDNCNMNNGTGLRCVIWLSGCSHHCVNCFNPETWDENNGEEVTEVIIQELFDCLDNDWCSGITLTGGDPMYYPNRNELSDLCSRIKLNYPGKNIWMYTGYTYDEIKNEPVLRYIDVLADGKFVDELKDSKLHWVGSSNQRLIDVKQTKKQNKIVIYEE